MKQEKGVRFVDGDEVLPHRARVRRPHAAGFESDRAESVQEHALCTATRAATALVINGLAESGAHKDSSRRQNDLLSCKEQRSRQRRISVTSCSSDPLEIVDTPSSDANELRFVDGDAAVAESLGVTDFASPAMSPICTAGKNRAS